VFGWDLLEQILAVNLSLHIINSSMNMPKPLIPLAMFGKRFDPFCCTLQRMVNFNLPFTGA
jgi:hypothetical protein